MKVLLDENFPLPLLDALRRGGIDADHIITLDLRGAPDSALRLRLDHESIVLLTNDTEFLMVPMPKSGWVIVSRVKQSRQLDDRIEIWIDAIRKFLAGRPDSRINELFDDGQLLPWRDVLPEE